MLKVAKGRKSVENIAKIFGVCSAYTILFGFLFGECFGTLGHDVFGLKPLLFDRHKSIMPMLYFSFALGAIHVFIGLILGVLSAFRRRDFKEALAKAVSIFFILCLAIVVWSQFTPSLEPVKKPLYITALVFIPVLLFTGGLLAPLELLKSVGNIISYARIMAIGLTSVLLAYVANYLAGTVGSIWVGILIAVLLHSFNILLGIFAPTIHSLRLHYVEFFSKFMEPSSGREFKPLGKK